MLLAFMLSPVHIMANSVDEVPSITPKVTGIADLQLADHVVINEAKFTPTDSEWVEIANPTASDVDISNWHILTDDGTSSEHTFYFPAGTILTAESAIVITRNATNFKIDADANPAGVDADFQTEYTTGSDVPCMLATAGGVNTTEWVLQNSDEALALYDESDTLVDMFGWMDGLSDTGDDAVFTNFWPLRFYNSDDVGYTESMSRFPDCWETNTSLNQDLEELTYSVKIASVPTPGVINLDNLAPVISDNSHTPWVPTPNDNVTFYADVIDDISVVSVDLVYSSDNFATNTTVAMALDAGSLYNCTVLNTSLIVDQTYTYCFKAVDNIGAASYYYNGYMNFTVRNSYPFISEIAFQGEQYIVIHNPGSAAVNLTNWIITDEGASGSVDNLGSYSSAWQFPLFELAAGADVVIAIDGTGFETIYGNDADFQMNGTNEFTNMTCLGFGGTTDTFDLYGGGDQILLLSETDVVDAMIYHDWSSGVFVADSFLTSVDISEATIGQILICTLDTDDPATDFALAAGGVGAVPEFGFTSYFLLVLLVAIPIFITKKRK